MNDDETSTHLTARKEGFNLYLSSREFFAIGLALQGTRGTCLPTTTSGQVKLNKAFTKFGKDILKRGIVDFE